MRIAKLGALKAHIENCGQSLSGDIATRLREAFKRGVSPAPVAEALIERFSVALPDDLYARLVEMTPAGSSLAVSSARMLAGLAASSEGAIAPASPASGDLRRFESLRPILRPLAQRTLEGMLEGGIVLAEASTGSGKGRLIAELAIDGLSRGNVVIAAPLAVTRQLIGELRGLAPALHPALILGRANFVDPELLALWLSENDHPELAQWHAKGGRPASEATRRLSEAVGGGLAWLIDDAAEIAGDEPPVRSWTLEENAEEGNAAESAYQALRERARHEDTRLIVCSHMMVAAHLRSRQRTGASLLPEKIHTLLVDEAHQLENAVASVNSDVLHLHALGRVVRSAGLGSASEREALRSLERLNAAVGAEKAVLPRTGVLKDFGSIESELRVLSEALSGRPRSNKRTPAERQAARRRVGALAGALRDALSGKATMQLALTPVLERPLLTIGRANLDSLMQRLWENVDCAALVSATLYLPDASGVPHGGYSRWVLAVPKERVRYVDPVVPAWVVGTPTLHYCLAPMAPDDSPLWHDTLAAQVQDIYRGASGGTLVLCTSHATVAALRSRLAGLGEALVAQDERTSASLAASQFRARSHAGLKPLWLGVGAAWTGIDLSDASVPPADDRLLTDLFIPRIPFRVNRTLTHDRRQRMMPMADLYETLRMLRQGLGRLVRREGLQERRVWFGDLRVEKSGVYYRTIKRLLESYRKG